MKRLIPLRLGLTQRTMLLLVAVVSGSLAVLAMGFALQRQDDFADFLDAQARGIASQVHSTRLVLESVPAAYRESVSEGLRASGTVHAYPASAAAPPAARSNAGPRDGLFTGLFGVRGASGDVSEAISRYTLQPAEVRSVVDPVPSYWVSQPVDGEPWWIVVLAGRPPPAAGGLPWFAVSAVLLALFAVAAWYAATITRPLRDLVNATHRIGEGWPDPVPVNGPPELRDLAQSFNSMLVRLRQIEAERRVLLGGLPHDLRAPLTRLRLRLETLGELGEHPGIVDDITSIDRIVRQFTAYLQGVQPEEPRKPLDEIVQAAVDAYRGLGRDVRLGGGTDCQVPLPQFAARRLLDNLIENAVQHGQEPVHVQLSRFGEGGVDLMVTDQGAGIPQEAADLAMEPFTKLDPARGRGGCGLGLAIVRQLARQLGGGIRFVKKPNSFSVIVHIGVQ